MNNQKSFSGIVTNFALIFALLGIAMMLINDPAADPKDISNLVIGFLGMALMISIPVFATKYYRDQGYHVSIGSSIKLGVLIGLLGGLIIGIFAYIYFAYINPEAIDQVLELSRQVLEENGMFNEEMVEQQMETTKQFFLPMQIFGQIFGGLIYGLIGGLLGGVFYKTPTEEY
jgi:hypothetical protein